MCGLIRWPLTLTLIPLFVYVLTKCIQDVEAIRETSQSRGAALFRRLWLAPDFIVLGLGLVISSEALHSILLQKGIQTFYGDKFAKYFWTLLGSYFVILLMVIFIWLSTTSEASTFPLSRELRRRLNDAGEFVDREIYRVHYVRGLFGSRVGLWNIVIGNLLGLLTIVLYGFFVYFGFVEKLPWLD